MITSTGFGHTDYNNTFTNMVGYHEINVIEGAEYSRQ